MDSSELTQTGGITLKLRKPGTAPVDQSVAPGPVAPGPTAAVPYPVPETVAKFSLRKPLTAPKLAVVPATVPAPKPVAPSVPLAPLTAPEEDEEPAITVEPVGATPSLDQLKKFYENRVKKPKLYEFDARGNLVLKTESGRVEKVYTIPPYYPPSKEDLQQLDVQRREDVAALEGRYDEAVDALRVAYGEYKAGTGSALAVKLANDAVQLLDMQRTKRQFELQEVVIRDGVPIKDILFEKQATARTMPHVAFVRRRAYSLQTEYAREGQERIPAPAEVAPQETEAPEGTIMGGAVEHKHFISDVARSKNIIAYARPEDNEYGFLSTFYPVEFTMDGVRYFTVEQAVAAEKARRFHDDKARTEIMNTRAPRTMRTKANGIIPKPISETHGAPSPRLDEWENKLRPEILEEATYQKFRQHADLRDQLLGTGDTTIVLADSAEKKDGIGLALDNKDMLDSAKWRGENLYGKILMSVRKRLRSEMTGGEDEEAVLAYEDGGAVEDSTISAGAYEEKTEKARNGAIVGHFANLKRVHF